MGRVKACWELTETIVAVVVCVCSSDQTLLVTSYWVAFLVLVTSLLADTMLGHVMSTPDVLWICESIRIAVHALCTKINCCRLDDTSIFQFLLCVIASIPAILDEVLLIFMLVFVNVINK